METGLMPQNVLGLEIGQSTIKAVLLAKKGLTGGRILDVRVLDIDTCGGVEPALKTLADDKNFSGFPCSISVSPRDMLFRHVQLPFRDDNRIRKTLLFELEPLIPLPIEDVIADYLIMPRSGLLVGILNKKNVRDITELVENNLGNVVSVIDASPTALAVQITDNKKMAGSKIVLDIGRMSTSATFYEDDAIIHVRSLAFGGEQITRAMAADLSVDRDGAEKMKISGSYSETIMKTNEECRRFCAELKNTVEYMKINGVMQNEPGQILLTGGGALFAPLCKELGNHFSCPLEMLDLIKSKSLDVEKNIAGRIQPAIMNTAVAVALRISAGKKSFNFRQEEFAARRSRFNFKNQLRWASVLTGIIILLAAANQILDYSLKTRQLNGAKKEISRIFKSSFPDAQAMVDPVQQLETKIAEDKKTFGFGEGLSEATAIEILKDISRLIVPSLDIVLTGLNYENRVISIKGEAKTIDEVTSIKNELVKSKYFQDVTMGSTSLTKDGGKVDFSLRIEVK